MRIKNLDTGEEYDLEEFDSQVPSDAGFGTHSGVDPPESEDAQPKGPAGKQAKVWLKGTKKLKTWAKSTLSNVRERIEERIEKQQTEKQQRELQKQPQPSQSQQHAQHSTRHPQHLSQHRSQQPGPSPDGEPATSSSGTGFGGGGWDGRAESEDGRRDAAYNSPGVRAGAPYSSPGERYDPGHASSRSPGGRQELTDSRDMTYPSPGAESLGVPESLQSPSSTSSGPLAMVPAAEAGEAPGAALAPAVGAQAEPIADALFRISASSSQPDPGPAATPVQPPAREPGPSHNGSNYSGRFSPGPLEFALREAAVGTGKPQEPGGFSLGGGGVGAERERPVPPAFSLLGGEAAERISEAQVANLDASASAASVAGTGMTLGSATHMVLPVSTSASSLTESAAPRGSVTQMAAGSSGLAAPPRPPPGVRGGAAGPATPGPSSSGLGADKRSTVLPGLSPVITAPVATPPPGAAAAAGPGATGGLTSHRPGALPSSAHTSSVPAAALPLSPVVVPPIPLAAEGAAAHQQSEELRVPLLEDDPAGPSSRAVPTTRSWLNQAARVIGGRKANRQLQQVRMIQELVGHDGAVWAMRFSADSRLLATAGRDGVLRVWSVYWYPQSRSKLISATRDSLSSLPPPSSSTGTLAPPLYSSMGGAPPPYPAPSGASFSTGLSGAPPPSSSAAAAAAAAPASRPPLLSESPLLSLYGHRGDVLDLSWSQCRLLLTASADQTARLWYIDTGGTPGGRTSGAGVSGGGAGGGAGYGVGLGSGTGGMGSFPTGECLRSFVHPDFVTSCSFHPTDPRVIVTGCADGKIRVWSVPDATVVATATVQQDLVTRVLFSNDGSRVVAGTMRGKARYYEFTATPGGAAGGTGGAGGAAGAAGGSGIAAVSGGAGGVGGGGSALRSGASLEYLTQLDVKNAHGSGRKVTGLAQVPYSYGNDQLYVITSADSRIRLYVGYAQERKFKGHRNTNTQIAASLSPNCQHLICGSDDGWVYLWETGLPPPPSGPPPGTAPGGAGAAASAAAAAAAGAYGRVAAAAASAAAAAGALAAAARSRAHGAAVHAAGLVVGGGKVKEGTYEAFQTPESTTTVALFAPTVCRMGRGLDRQVFGSAGGAPPGSAAAAAASTSPAPGLMGALFVVAGFSGRIYVYENLPPGM